MDKIILATPHKLRNIHLDKRKTEEEIKIFNKWKANELDEISSWVLRGCADDLSKAMQILFKKSLNQDKSPEIWKEGNTVPLYSVVSKILEKLIRKR